MRQAIVESIASPAVCGGPPRLRCASKVPSMCLQCWRSRPGRRVAGPAPTPLLRFSFDPPSILVRCASCCPAGQPQGSGRNRQPPAARRPTGSGRESLAGHGSPASGRPKTSDSRPDPLAEVEASGEGVGRPGPEAFPCGSPAVILQSSFGYPSVLQGENRFFYSHNRRMTEGSKWEDWRSRPGRLHLSRTPAVDQVASR